MKYLIFCLFLFLMGCSTGAQYRKVDITAYGMYLVHPTYGLIGLGTISYHREPGNKDGKTLDLSK